MNRLQRKRERKSTKSKFSSTLGGFFSREMDRGKIATFGLTILHFFTHMFFSRRQSSSFFFYTLGFSSFLLSGTACSPPLRSSTTLSSSKKPPAKSSTVFTMASWTWFSHRIQVLKQVLIVSPPPRTFFCGNMFISFLFRRSGRTPRSCLRRIPRRGGGRRDAGKEHYYSCNVAEEEDHRILAKRCYLKHHITVITAYRNNSNSNYYCCSRSYNCSNRSSDRTSKQTTLASPRPLRCPGSCPRRSGVPSRRRRSCSSCGRWRQSRGRAARRRRRCQSCRSKAGGAEQKRKRKNISLWSQTAEMGFNYENGLFDSLSMHQNKNNSKNNYYSSRRPRCST